MSTAKKPQATIGNFVLNNDATYTWTVYPEVPGADGKRLKTKLVVEFRHISEQRRVEILDEVRQRKDAGEGTQIDDGSDVGAVKSYMTFRQQLLDEALVGFSGIKDQHGNDLPFSESVKAQLLSNSWAVGALHEGFLQSLQHRDTRGN